MAPASLYVHAQVAQMKNVTAVNNTLYNNDDRVYVRWGGTNMNPGEQCHLLTGENRSQQLIQCPGNLARKL